MTGPFADRLFRIAFVLAGCYNLAFGIWAAFWPLAFFELFDLAPPRYSGIWACLGMVVGVYGLLYLHAAWNLQTAWPIIAVGLLGKTLGPLGMAMSFGDEWPQRLGMVCVYNDVIWWLPFGLFLARGTAFGRWLASMAPWLCAGSHAVAVASMVLVLRGGTLAEPDVAARASYIANRSAEWTIGWAVWMFAAMTLVGFYAWWGGRLAARKFATIAVVVAAVGMVCDHSGEALSSLVLFEQASAMTADPSAQSRFVAIEYAALLLTAGASNALYTLAGIVLTLATPSLPLMIRVAMWTTWIAGVAMTVGAVLLHIDTIVVATAVLFPLLIVWTAWMGARWRLA